jgi:3-oxoadipate CoA-transferase, alpha subunit
MKKPVMSPADAVADIEDGASVLVSGFGGAGVPHVLLDALVERGVKDLTVISNNAGKGRQGLAALILQGCVRRLICSYPSAPGADDVLKVLASGEVDFELVPQGTLVERIRAGGAGLGGFLTPTGVGTAFAEGREVIEVDGVPYLLEHALTADFALVHAHDADTSGNLRYRHAARNFAPVMATAGRTCVAEVAAISPDGLDPDSVHTPGIFVDRLVALPA